MNIYTLKSLANNMMYPDREKWAENLCKVHRELRNTPRMPVEGDIDYDPFSNYWYHFHKGKWINSRTGAIVQQPREKGIFNDFRQYHRLQSMYAC